MSESLDSSGTNMARMIRFLRAHKRLSVIIFSWVAFCAFVLIPNWREGPFYLLFFSSIFLMLIASQVFWVGRVGDLGERFIPGKPWRVWLRIIMGVLYLSFFAHQFIPWDSSRGNSTHLTLRSVLFGGVWSVWLVGSWVGFGMVMFLWTVDRGGRAAAWVYRNARKVAAGHAAAPMPGATALDPPSPARRRLLEQAVVAVSAVPFVAAAYGLLYERLDVEVTHPRIRLASLPKAFEGFRIVQLSDFHISPFMTADEIRRCVTIANGLKADLVALTGDYLADDPAAEGEVVQVLSALKAPFGAFGCLGNHEFYTETEDSITRLFGAEGIRILRQERVLIQSHGEVLNLIGVDYQQRRFSRDHEGHLVDRYLEGSEKLVMPDIVNILLSHNPNSFDRAAELGIDLTLAGHSHGGQLTLSFVNRGLTLVRPETPYVRVVRKTRQPAIRQPRYRNHRSPHPPRRQPGDYAIGVDQNVTPACQTSRIGEIGGNFLLVYRRAIAHWRVIVLGLILARAVFYVIHPDEFGLFFDLLSLGLLVVFIASQVFWIKRIIDLVARFLPSRIGRTRLAVVAALIYLFVYAYSYPGIQSTNDHIFRTGYDRPLTMVSEALFWWWFVGSMLAFFLVLVFGAVDYAERAITWTYTKIRDTTRQHASVEISTPASPSRRHFMRQSAVLVSATPFVVAGYGLLFGREDVEVVRQRVRLVHLPKGFDGFRIAQLSDIHMGPFTTAHYIQRCVAITNGLKPDLIALTGDYIAWDPGLERRVVSVLAGLRAQHGVFGCLGNHEEESDTEEYVSGLFTAQGVRILRQEQTPIRLGADELNLIGIDCPRTHAEQDGEEEYRRDVNRRLHRKLVMPGTVNVLLSHEPSVFVFDRAADLGIDLMLTGHSHGGQLGLEFVHRGLNLSHLLYRYTSGWYEQRSTKLYVNRGIGTTGFPIRLGARPEITVFELTRGA